MIISTFNGDNIANIKTQHHQIMATITDTKAKTPTIIENPIMANHSYF